MLDSNVPDNLMTEILSLVPDALDDADEYWRVVPYTAEGWIYSVSSKRNILVKHTRMVSHNRIQRCKLMKMMDDCGVFYTSIRRSKRGLSNYIEHIRYDAFPELNEVKTLEDDIHEAVDMPFEGLQWYGRHKQTIHILPVSDSDMQQVRKFYPEDLPREVWAYVPETNRKYVISTHSRGVILKHYSVDGRILKSQIWQLRSGENDKNCKYFQCCITVGNKQVATLAHQQVLKSFISKPEGDYEVNHIDGDSFNNILDNLEWVTRQENSIHYNTSPEMAYKRAIGYKKISEYGRLHQKEIQNRPEVQSKRSKSCSESWTSERKASYSTYLKNEWANFSEEQRASRLSGFTKHNCHQES